MKIQKTVLKETGHIALGVLILDIVMCLVFALLKRFDYTVCLGALLGSVFAVGNFFLLGLALQKALDLGDGAAKYMHASYSRRMLLFVVCIAVSVLVPCFNPIAAIAPLLFPRIVIFVMQLLGMYKPEKIPAPAENQEGGKTE
ncbi:MAG: ATP synthase subunit I [Clostridia bacterium]|nr:ATP synthase subunit I [Clostridia bacterium]